jgi:hypothetical protein
VSLFLLQLSPNLRKTEVIREKDKELAAAAAGGEAAVKKPPPKKRGAEGDAAAGAAAEAKVLTPADKEVNKLEQLLGLGDKPQRAAN